MFDPIWQIFVCTLQCATRRAEGGRRSVLVASSSHHPPDGLPSLTQPAALSSSDSVPGLLSLEEDALCPQHSLLTAQPAQSGLVAAAGQPRHHRRHHQHRAQHINNLPMLSLPLCSLVWVCSSASLPPSVPPFPLPTKLRVSWGPLRPAGTGATQPKLEMLTEMRIYLWWKRRMKYSITYENFGAKNI